MRPSTLLLVSSLSLSLTGCCMEISGGRDSLFQSSLHDDDCRCSQHSHSSRRPVIAKSSRPVRKTRPLFAGDRWSESQYTMTSFHNVGVPNPCVCGGVCGGGCGDWSGGLQPVLPLCGGSDCSAPQPIWGDDAGCQTPAWTSDINCSAPAIPSPHFIQGDPGCHSPFGMPAPGPSHGPGCNCGQQGHQGHPMPHRPHGPVMHPAPHGPHGPHGQPGPFGHTGPMNHGPGSSLPAPSGQHGPPEQFHAPAAPIQPMPAPPAETPVPMPMPEEAPAPGPVNPVEQTNWEVPVFPPIP